LSYLAPEWERERKGRKRDRKGREEGNGRREEVNPRTKILVTALD